ncbi:MAG: aldehyde ferredoxin oxidoreductase family protein [Candidatus Bathyarchaeia archaeon]|jgi:aldehyde:ferredoxin oxidoreductase
MNEYHSKILHVDLNDRRVWVEDLSQQTLISLLGGRGINALLLWKHVNETVDPLSPANVLIFGPGLLAGSGAPSSGRTTVTCKGPITNLYLKSSMGGHWGAEFRFTGFDHLLLHGSSNTPVYLWIHDDAVEIRDATRFWGMDARRANQELKEDVGEKEAEVACIGPAGEKLVRFSAIMSSVYNAAARGGTGAVMGSKKLKAVVVRGTKRLNLHDPAKFYELSIKIREALGKEGEIQLLHKYGTSGSVEAVNALGALPNRNFQHGQIENVGPLTGQNLVDKGYLKKRIGCHDCIVSCHRYVEIRTGKFKGTYTGGPEYESFVSLGGQSHVIDTEAVIKANEYCNLLGLDTISTGVVIAWAMETYERGLLGKEDMDGLDVAFGNAEVLVEIIQRIGYREGRIGNLLAEGVKRASERVGHESWKWAMCNSKGLEQSSVETRSAKGYALAFAVNPRGPDHLHTQVFAEFGASPEALALIERITGDKKWASPILTEFRPEIIRWHEDCYAVTDALGFCSFTTTDAYSVSPKAMADFFTAATGIESDEALMMLAGRRIVTLEKCFNVREGATREIDDLPWRLMNEPGTSAWGKVMNSKQELDMMLDQYYQLHEWDSKTSWPYRITLERLGLGEVAAELEQKGKLPA